MLPAGAGELGPRCSIKEGIDGSLMKRDHSEALLLSVRTSKLATCCRSFDSVQRALLGVWRSGWSGLPPGFHWGGRPVACTNCSRRGETARSLAALRTSVALSASCRCAPSAEGYATDARVQFRPAASGRRDRDSGCRFRVAKRPSSEGRYAAMSRLSRPLRSSAQSGHSRTTSNALQVELQMPTLRA